MTNGFKLGYTLGTQTLPTPKVIRTDRSINSRTIQRPKHQTLSALFKSTTAIMYRSVNAWMVSINHIALIYIIHILKSNYLIHFKDGGLFDGDYFYRRRPQLLS